MRGRLGARGARAGWSLVELAIGMSLLGIAFLLSVAGFEATGQELSASQLQDATQAQAQRAAQRVTRELLSAGVSVMVPSATGDFGTEEMDFRQATGLEAGVIAWSEPMRVQLEYDPGELDDGLDNDGDGLADEGRLVLLRNADSDEEERVVLCHDVREFLEGETLDGEDDNGNGVVDERGFNLHWENGVLWLRLSLERTNALGQRALATVESAVDVRNP